MEVIVAVAVFASTVLVIRLMAFFALPPARAGPRCPRRDTSLKEGATRCWACKLELRT